MSKIIFDENKARELYDKKLSDVDIAYSFGFSASVIRKWRKRNNLPPKCKQTVLTDDIIAIIYDMYTKGKSDKYISNILNLGNTTVGQWRKRNKLPPNFKIGNPRSKLNEALKDYVPTEEIIDPESLYCNSKFLEKLLNKKL